MDPTTPAKPSRFTHDVRIGDSFTIGETKITLQRVPRHKDKIKLVIESPVPAEQPMALRT